MNAGKNYAVRKLRERRVLLFADGATKAHVKCRLRELNHEGACNVSVVGCSGVGKSTIVNGLTLRSLDDADAAPVSEEH